MDISQTQTVSTTRPKLKKKKQPRSRPLPPDVNSRNLAIEKRRRKDMNEIFSDLAKCMPPSASRKRLSKRLAVIESVKQLRKQREVCIAAGRELRELLSAHNDLIAEVNTLRSQLGIPIETAIRRPSKAFLSLMEVEKQQCGENLDACTEVEAESGELQVESQENDLQVSLSDPVSPPEAGSTSHPSVRDCSLHGFNVIPNPPLFWYGQLSEQSFPPPSIPDIDWWEQNISGQRSEPLWQFSSDQMLPWESSCKTGLQGYFGVTSNPASFL